MTLDSSSILQIDATIITGILILLTVSSFAQTDGTAQTDPQKMINHFKNVAIVVIILPFATSAMLTLYGRYRRVFGFEENRKKLDDSYETKLKKLEKELEILKVTRENLMREKGMEMPNYRERVQANRQAIIDKTTEIGELKKEQENKKDDLNSEIELDHPSKISIAIMIIGFGIMVSLLSVLSLLIFTSS